MTPERWRQVEEVYHAALERDPDQRPAFLSQACASDPELKREVESLLAQKSGDSLLGRPAWESAESLLDPTVTQLSSGAQLGPYRIETPLGKGGMGEVFRATDTRLHRTVAIKILPRDKVADPERKKRFLQEARAASALNHPNIVTLYDIASDAGVDYLVMECVPGKALDKIVLPKGLPVAEALNYAQQIASGLAAAHAAGIVHRDMKPGNVMVTPDSQVKILDFGLAKLADRAPGAAGETQTQEGALTAAGAVMGTVAYMSPEQASAKSLDHRTDIFSLGVMLYEMLAGQRPFRGKSQVETMHAIINEPHPPLRTASSRLEEILDKALEKDPKERYQSAGDLAVDLRRVQKAAPAPRPEPRAQRKPWVWIAAAAVVLAAGAAGWLALRSAAPADNPLANAQFTRLTDFPGDESAAALSPDGKFVVFVSDRDGRNDVWLSQVGTGQFQNLTKGTSSVTNGLLAREGGFTGDGSEIWLKGPPPPVQRMRILPLMGGAPRPFLGEHVNNVAWSPDGARMAYFNAEDGDPMFVAERDGSSPRRIFVDRPGVHNHFPTWSPDGRWIYFVHGNVNTLEFDLWRIAPTGGEPEHMTERNRYLGYPTPIDARTVLYVAADQDGSGPWLWALDVERKVSRRVSFGLERYASIAASADGRHLVAAVANPVAGLWSIPILDHPAEEREVKPYSVPNVRALMPRYGGKSLFYLSSQGGGDGLWRWEDGHASEVWKGAQGALLEPPAISADGRQAAVVLRRNGRRSLRLVAADGSEIRPLTEAIDVRGAAVWSPDGKWLVTGGTDGKGPGLFKIPVDGGAPVRLATGAALNPAWAPDGGAIVYSGAGVAGRDPVFTVRPEGGPVDPLPIQVASTGERLRFLPNSKGLVYMRGAEAAVDFWLLDLATKQTRQLTHLNTPATMRTFDITPDGKQIVCDRLRENSDIVLIDLPGKNK